MNSIVKYLFTGIISLVLYSGCDNAKVISSDEDSSLEDKTGIFSGAIPSSAAASGSAKANSDELHTVVVEEVLPTSKYVYLYVKENGKSFWIATVKQTVEVGKTYVYKGGLLKTNFESKEHNRIFDKMYLVSRLLPLEHGSSNEKTTTTTKAIDKKTPTVEEKVEREGSVKIADLVANPEKYEGQTIQLSGRCVKVNPNIMGRNWIHLKDGSQDDYDLVLTSDVAIPEGHIVTMKGLVVLNKDFGAGYRYELLLEDCVIVQ